MAVDLAALVGDLGAESADLEAILAPLEPAQWSLPTPAAGWSIADQVSHLAYFDETATVAATDPDRFRVEAAALLADGSDFPDRVAALHRHDDPAELLAWWRRSRRELLAVFSAIDPAVRLPWYGPDMSPASSLTARLMETWAHGGDVADTVGVTRTPTVRLRHVADLGVRTIAFSFALNDRPPPAAPLRVELVGPGGEPWAWGPEGVADRVSGPAEDFCLVVTQRRNVADTALVVDGPVATEWIGIAQAFAGAPSGGRPPASEARP